MGKGTKRGREAGCICIRLRWGAGPNPSPASVRAHRLREYRPGPKYKTKHVESPSMRGKPRPDYQRPTHRLGEQALVHVHVERLQLRKRVDGVDVLLGDEHALGVPQLTVVVHKGVDGRAGAAWEYRGRAGGCRHGKNGGCSLLIGEGRRTGARVRIACARACVCAEGWVACARGMCERSPLPAHQRA